MKFPQIKICWTSHQHVKSLFNSWNMGFTLQKDLNVYLVDIIKNTLLSLVSHKLVLHPHNRQLACWAHCIIHHTVRLIHHTLDSHATSQNWKRNHIICEGTLAKLITTEYLAFYKSECLTWHPWCHQRRRGQPGNKFGPALSEMSVKLKH